jgi:hypothetical protein
LALLAIPAGAADISVAPSLSAPVWSVFPVSTEEGYVPEFGRMDLSGDVHIRLEGLIENGDAARLREVLEEVQAPMGQDFIFGHVIVSMNSPGGNYLEGLAIGDVLAQRFATTYVGPGDVCLSACAFAFMGGRLTTIRGVDWEPSRILHIHGRLGFHAPSLPGTVPADVAQGAADILLDEFAKPTRETMRALQERAGLWQISPNLIFELLDRSGSEEFFDIERWQESIENLVMVVSPELGPPPSVGAVEAEQACGSLIGALLWDAIVDWSGLYYMGGDQATLPHVPALAVARGGAAWFDEFRVTETAGRATAYDLSMPLPGRGTIACRVWRDPQAGWRVSVTGDLPTGTPTAATLARDGSVPVTMGATLSYSLPWTRIGGEDLHVTAPPGEDGRAMLFAAVPAPVMAAADAMDFCATPNPALWPVTCRFPTLHRAARVFSAAVEAAKARDPGAGALYGRWTAEIARLCRPGEVATDNALSLTLAGYCGLKVTTALTAEALGLTAP